MTKRAKMTSHSKKKRKCRTLVAGAVKALKPVKTFPELVGLTLHDAVYRRNPDEILHIGTIKGSGFFFIGDRNEFERDIDKLGEINYADFRMRPVVDAYSKLDPNEGIIIILEGFEKGSFWIAEECRCNINVRSENPRATITGKKRGKYGLHKTRSRI